MLGSGAVSTGSNDPLELPRLGRWASITHVAPLAVNGGVGLGLGGLLH